VATPIATVVRDAIRSLVLGLRRQYLVRIWKMDLGEGTSVSFSARLDKTNPRGVHIGSYTAVAFGAAILAHDHLSDTNRDVFIGSNCFIGAYSIVLSGVTIGDSCVVSPASVVARDIPPGCIVIGNPARVVGHIEAARYGKRKAETPGA
jgi:acetyltransferase-like isoleucine patch superfamily enzyme